MRSMGTTPSIAEEYMPEAALVHEDRKEPSSYASTSSVVLWLVP